MRLANRLWRVHAGPKISSVVWQDFSGQKSDTLRHDAKARQSRLRVAHQVFAGADHLHRPSAFSRGRLVRGAQWKAAAGGALAGPGLGNGERLGMVPACFAC